MSLSVRRVTISAALAASLMLAGCTTEEQSTPAPTLTSTTSTTSTTTVPDEATTTTPTPASTEVITTDSTTTLPPGPTSALVPLLVGGADTSGWLFLGAWQEGAWQLATTPDDQPIQPGVEAGATFALSNLADQSDAISGAEAEACSDGRIGPSFDVGVAAPDPPGFGYSTIAVLAPTWTLKPRAIAVSASAPASYQALGEAAFVDATVDATLGRFDQLVIADLDGDGDDEALGVFESIQQGAGPGAVGDLAAMLLIDPATKASTTVSMSFVGPGVADGESPTIERFRVLDVVDLNGDGRMEIVIHSWRGESASVTVYSYDGTGLTEVLRTGCGT